MTNTTALAGTPGNAEAAKSHYLILDGLRGVAALMVVAFHIFEAFAFGNPTKQIINHGYLAVDFFFLLSGFVIAYAYDDRLKNGMTTGEFFKRRLIRLQPMLIIGSIIGAALFAFQAFPIYPKHADAGFWQVIIVMLIGFTMIPLTKSAEIRGWDEMYPLNGPAWSLFYEYVANFIYAIGLYKLPIKVLGVLVAISGLVLLHYALTVNGTLIGGWKLDGEGIRTGLTRVAFPFLAGVLLMRLGKRIKVKHGFAVCSLLLVVALSLPRIGGEHQAWMNGLYEALCVLFLFPLIVMIGAGEKDVQGVSVSIARFFGNLSYPIYITHYPLIYIYTAWIMTGDVPLELGIAAGIGVFIASVAIAWVSLKLFDEPVRKWLAQKLLKRA